MPIEPPWLILCIDDDKQVLGELEEFLASEEVDTEGSIPQVLVEGDFDRGLQRIESTRVDLLVLDVRVGTGHQQPGIEVLEQVKKRRFLPVVFYTAIPGSVRDVASPVIRVVEKTEGLRRLLEEVRAVFSTKVPTVNRALIQHVEAVQRNYMWEFVSPQWEAFGEAGDKRALAYLLARRLAVSLSGAGIGRLAEDLGDVQGAEATPEGIPPMRYYLLPPVEPTPLAGDIYQGTIDGADGYWLLLTPSCDLVEEHVKADLVLFARCLPLEGEEEYQKWHDGWPQPSITVTDPLRRLLRNSRTKGQSERYYFLPGTLTLPHLVVDLQFLARQPHAELGSLARIASLDSPFAEEVISRFLRYWGRLGTPDLDISLVLQQLMS